MIDTATVKVQAGKGGDGIVSFKRIKYNPKGGPWGGDGGTGGDIVLRVDAHLNTLTSFRRKRIYEAENGMPGMRDRMKGRDGVDMIVRMPPGTLIRNEEGDILHDMTTVGQEAIIAQGGKGGLGNWHFKSSVNRTPRIATAGIKTDPIVLNLELKLIADVGIIGLPSSGKSTLLNTITRTEVKTAEYHFTTLEPNLGVLSVESLIPHTKKDIVLADIPGLIEGAADGKGLGHNFLRHIERTKVLIHTIDGAEVLHSPAEKLIENYVTIQNELKAWNPLLLKKPQVIAINKIDITEVAEKVEEITTLFGDMDAPVVFISAATGENNRKLVEEVLKLLENVKDDEQFKPVTGKPKHKSFTIDNLKNKRILFRKPQIPQ